METTKHPRIVYLLLAAMFVVTAAVAMPTTNAKYATSKKYTINIESHVIETLEFILKKNVMSTTAGAAP